MERNGHPGVCACRIALSVGLEHLAMRVSDHGPGLQTGRGAGLWGLASVTCLMLGAGDSGLAGYLNDGRWRPDSASLAAAAGLALAAAALALAGRRFGPDRR